MNSLPDQASQSFALSEVFVVVYMFEEKVDNRNYQAVTMLVKSANWYVHICVNHNGLQGEDACEYESHF